MAKCNCGLCDEETQGGLFRPGHDQTLRAHLESRVGGLLPMRDLIVALEAYASGKASDEAMTAAVRKAFWRG